jgi:hypothetical protein
MKASHVLWLSVLVSGLLLIGCKGNDVAAGPVGPSGPVLVGDVGGYVHLIDSVGNPATINSGISVSLDSTTLGAVTDSAGRWVIHNLKTGTYWLRITKAGFGTYVNPNFSFVGGGPLYFTGSVNLFTIPHFVPTGVTADTLGSVITIKGNFVGPIATWAGNCAIAFISTSPTVSSNPSNYTFYRSDGTYSANFSIGPISLATLKYYGVMPGTSLYIIVYAGGYLLNTYYDFTSNKEVFTSLNPTPSSIVSVVAP